MPNFPENKQMNNFLHIFFQHPLYLKKMGKKFFFQFFFSGARVWGLWQNNAVSLSKHLTTHIDMILLFFAKNSQKWPILKISEIAKNNNNNKNKKITIKYILQIKLS